MSPTKRSDQRVAVIVPAKDEAKRIAATVRACRSVPRVDLVVVVDDGSDDGTQDHARAAGAVTVRHSVTRGKASAMETGASVVGMRDYVDGPARLLLFVDADLGDSAAACADLVPPVVDGVADMAIALPPKQQGAGGRGRVVRTARRAIARATGWQPVAPLSGQRCLTREAYEAAAPLAEGWGVEVAMTIDVLVAGMAVIEVPCDITHRVTGNDRAGVLHRASQYRDVVRAITARALRRHRVPSSRYERAAEAQNPCHVYRSFGSGAVVAPGTPLRGITKVEPVGKAAGKAEAGGREAQEAGPAEADGEAGRPGEAKSDRPEKAKADRPEKAKGEDA